MVAALSAVALAVPSLSAQQPAPAPPDRPTLVARLDSVAADFQRSGPAAGLTVAVLRRGDTLLLKGYGERDRDKHLPADAATVYRIASITKQFTSAAIMRLVERGAVGLEDPVTAHLPQYPQWSGITVRQLLNHTSGIRSYTSVPEWRKTWATDLTPGAIVAFVEKDTLEFKPGTAFRYNNTAYVMLGMIVERASTKSYATYLRDEFFTPLGMRSATYCPSKPTSDRHALGYGQKDGAYTPSEYLSLTHPYSAGALCMSVPDYLRWQTALMAGKVVSPASLALMVGPEKLADGKSTDYGFGLETRRVADRPVIQHGGAINGFSTQQLWFPADSLRVVIFANTERTNVDWLAGTLSSAVFGRPLSPRRPPLVPLAAADRVMYEGSYDIYLPDGKILPIRFFSEGDGLMAQPEGQNKTPLLHFGNRTFGADFDPTLRLTFKVEGDKVAGAQLVQRGATMNVTRLP
jgi:CubicO group peptidase (beta-lactamase class C family)